MERLKFTPEDAAYGLRNLFVMDEEETRIIEISDSYDFGNMETQTIVTNLVAEDKFEDAYRVAIRHAFEGLTKPERDKIITDWVNEWNESNRDKTKKVADAEGWKSADDDDADYDEVTPEQLIEIADGIVA